MRTLHEFMNQILVENPTFVIIWSSDTLDFKVRANDRLINYKWRGWEDREDVVDRVYAYFANSQSARKALMYLNKFADPVIPEKTIKYTKLGKNAVHCPFCGYEDESSFEGVKCPNCEAGILERE